MEKTYFRRMIFILFISGFFPTGVSATPLGSVTITDFCPEWSDSSSVIFYMSLSDDDIVKNINRPVGVGSYFPDATLDPFFRRSLTLNDIGSTFVINQGNYLFWDSMVNYVLADGDQDMSASNLGWVDHSPSTLAWDFSQNYSGNGVDFQGYIINNLLLTIDDLQVQEAYPGNYNWTASWTLTVDGQSVPVPEPATLLLFGTGIAGVVGTRIRKKK